MGSYILIFVILAIFIYFAYNQDKLPSWMKRNTNKRSEKHDTDTEDNPTDTESDTEDDHSKSGCRASKQMKKKRDALIKFINSACASKP